MPTRINAAGKKKINATNKNNSLIKRLIFTDFSILWNEVVILFFTEQIHRYF